MKMIGIAKRDIDKYDIIELPVDLLNGELLQNKYVNFIHGTKLEVLKSQQKNQ